MRLVRDEGATKNETVKKKRGKTEDDGLRGGDGRREREALCR